jgi:hypothetical protein
LETPLVVERHLIYLAERILTVEHPAVGARQQCVGDIAQVDFHGGPRPRRWARSLNPLALEIRWNLRTLEGSGSGVANPDFGTRDQAFGIQKLELPPVSEALVAAAQARGHQSRPLRFEARESRQRFERLTSQNIPIGVFERSSDPHSRPPGLFIDST